ncbi:MAG TPA: 5-oxoprolinase subunit PxpA [Opitutaceae bacterium]|nr:5-oxoprolinase subunit PxpA [Opitutaceae bacterium]
MPRIDLNCDLGEGAGHDAALMPLITSANIACGAHAGDLDTMRATVALAGKHGVTIGAHPGFADREHFGRRELPLSPFEVHDLVVSQIRALQKLGAVQHVKPHGALYSLAARDAGTAGAIAAAVHAAGPSLVLFAPPNSELARAGRARGLRVAQEVFSDRTYQRDGTLTPRSRPDALVPDAEAAVAQVLRMLREGFVRATDGTDVPVAADTVCVHGDAPDAAAFAQRLRAGLQAAGIEFRPFGP